MGVAAVKRLLQYCFRALHFVFLTSVIFPSHYRSTKTHPGPVVHLSDSPKDEGKVCRRIKASPSWFSSSTSAEAVCCTEAASLFTLCASSKIWAFSSAVFLSSPPPHHSPHLHPRSWPFLPVGHYFVLIAHLSLSHLGCLCVLAEKEPSCVQRRSSWCPRLCFASFFYSRTKKKEAGWKSCRKRKRGHWEAYWFLPVEFCSPRMKPDLKSFKDKRMRHEFSAAVTYCSRSLQARTKAVCLETSPLLEQHKVNPS